MQIKNTVCDAVLAELSRQVGDMGLKNRVVVGPLSGNLNGKQKGCFVSVEPRFVEKDV